MEGRVQELFQWLDDFQIFSKDEKELFVKFNRFHKVCTEVGLMIHAVKTHLFLKEVVLCGRDFSEDDVQF